MPGRTYKSGTDKDRHKSCFPCVVATCMSRWQMHAMCCLQLSPPWARKFIARSITADDGSTPCARRAANGFGDAAYQYTQTSRRTSMPVSQSTCNPTSIPRVTPNVIEVSKRIRWDIDRDVIRGREFDFTKKFLPDGLSFVDRLPFLGADERRLLSPDPGAHLRQHVRPGRAFHRRQDARGEPRPLARRPDRARGAGALHRRRAEAPGAVSPDRDA